ncbi:MAG: RES family NAD+ phosphorylase [Chloroflexi bacterium]|nr:RES family NAD+ phosphorylase [Chloroflexota bacterium]
MVRIDPPPPLHPPSPTFHHLVSKSHLVRIFDPTDHGATATGFRFYGPLRRFDHHRSFVLGPSLDPARGIYYAALSLEGCLVEVFGDVRVVEFRDYHVARPVLTRDLRLVDLRGNGAMRAGSVAALAKVADYAHSQAWSRYFYEYEDIFTRADGLIYFNAHNDDQSIALYERAEDALVCSPEDVIRLDHPDLRPAIQDFGLRTGIGVAPGPRAIG